MFQESQNILPINVDRIIDKLTFLCQIMASLEAKDLPKMFLGIKSIEKIDQKRAEWELAGGEKGG